MEKIHFENAEEPHNLLDQENPDGTLRPEQVKFTRLFLIPRFFMGMLSQVMVFTTVTFLHPTLAVKLENLGYSEIFIGASFAIPTLIYASTSPLIYVLTSRIRKSGVIFLGYLVIGTAMFLVGPSLLLRLHDLTSFTMVGLCLMGLGCGMIIIPVLPDMIEATEDKHPGTDMDQLHNSISGMFIAM